MVSIDGASRIPCLPDEVRWMFEDWVFEHFPEIPDDPAATCLARGLFTMGDLESVSRGLGRDWREVLDGRFLNAFSLSALDEHVEGVEVDGMDSRGVYDDGGIISWGPDAGAGRLLGKRFFRHRGR